MRRIVAMRLAIPLTLLRVALPAMAEDRGGTPKSGSGLLRTIEPAPRIEPGLGRTGVPETIRAVEAVSKDLGAALDGAKTRVPAEREDAAPVTVPVPAAPGGPGEPEAVRAEATERLKALEKDGPAASTKEVREVLVERLRLLKEWEKAVASRKAAEAPKVSPEREAEELKAELARCQANLDRGAKAPETLLPEAFRIAKGRVSEASIKAMKEAIDGAEDAARDRKAALDHAAADAERKEAGPLAALRADREALRRRREELAARVGERGAAPEASQTVEGRALARERAINAEWEARVASEQLRAVDAAIALEMRRGALCELRRQGRQAAWELAERTLERMQARYRVLADRQQHDLTRQAADEQARADRAGDPLERYRARRAAELLDLEAQLLKDERTLAARPAVTLEEQATLADRAEEDFAHLKKLVGGGRSGALVAQRLNNSYRRTISERERLVHNESMRAAAVLEVYENALTDLELDTLNEARDDRAVLDALLESLPPSRRPAALAMAADLDAKRRSILADRRLALQRLVERAESTQQQVQRRLRILDEQHAFIRTHIFWVRDAAPIGPATLEQARRESRRLARAVGRLAFDPTDRALWGRASWEFLLACVGIVALPWPLAMTRRALRPPPIA